MVLKGEPVDRVPISLYEFDGFYDSWIHKAPEYAPPPYLSAAMPLTTPLKPKIMENIIQYIDSGLAYGKYG